MATACDTEAAAAQELAKALWALATAVKAGVSALEDPAAVSALRAEVASKVRLAHGG